MDRRYADTIVTEPVRQLVDLLESTPADQMDQLLDWAEEDLRRKTRPGLNSWLTDLFLSAVRRGDYGVLSAFARSLDIPAISARIVERVEAAESWANNILRLRGKDPETTRPLRRPAGAPRRDRSRLQAQILLRQGVGYREAAIGLWLLHRPYSVEELLGLAREATTLRGRGGKIVRTEAGARQWLASRGRGLRRGLDRAWVDVHGKQADPPGLRGFFRLTTKVLSEWPADALESLEAAPRRGR